MTGVRKWMTTLLPDCFTIVSANRDDCIEIVSPNVFPRYATYSMNGGK